MAVKTQIGLEEMKNLCEMYGIGEIKRMDGIGRGNTQTNYCLQTDAGRFVFRLYENRTREQVRFEMDTLAFLSGKGFACPKPVDAGKIGAYAGKPYALFAFLEGGHAQEWSGEKFKSAARTAAEMSLLLKGFKPETAPFRWNYGPELCEKLAREYAAKFGKEEKLEWYLSALSALELPEGMPMGVCHADWDISNMFFEGDRVSALLDFDDANYTFALYDLAAQTEAFRPDFRWDTWQDFAPEDEVIDLAMARMLAGAYGEVRQPEEVEKEHLFDLVKLTVLVDCLWYFGRGDGDFYEKRKIEALDRFGRERFRKEVFGE